MAIVVTCTNGHKLRVKDQSAGKKVRCPKCQDVVRVPVSARPRPHRPQSPPVEVSPEPSEDFGGDEEWAPRPQRRRSTKSTKARASSGSSSKLPIFIGGGVALVAVVGVVIFFVMRHDKPDPQNSDSQNTAESSPKVDDAAAVKKTVGAFLEATKKEDHEAIKTNLTRKAREKYTPDPSSPIGKDATFQIGKASIDKDAAKVRVELKDGPMEMSAYVRLRREEKQWRVYGIGLGDGTAEGPLEAAMFVDFENPDKDVSGGGRPHVGSNVSSQRTVGNGISRQPTGGNSSIRPQPGSIRSRRPPKNDNEPESEGSVEFIGSGYTGGFSKKKSKNLVTTVNEGGYSKQLTLSYAKPMGLHFPPENPEPPLYGILELNGKPLVNATAFGFLTIDSARDNTGKELKLRASRRRGRNTEEFAKLSSGMMFPGGFGSFNQEKPVRIPLILDSPPISAKQLKRLEGSVQVIAGGELKKVVVPQVLQKIGSEVSDPLLKKAGLTVKIDKGNFRKPEQQKKTLTVVVSGSEFRLLKIKLLDSRNKSLSDSMSWSGSGQTTMYMITGNKKELPADAQLVLEIAVDQQPVTVPFKFENVKLPANPEAEPAKLLTTGVQQKLTLSYERPFGAGGSVPFGTKALFATLELTSQPIANASSYGVFQVKTAQDNKGKSLKLVAPVKTEFGQALSRQYVDRMGFNPNEKDTLKFQVLIELPSPEATHLARLEGSLRVKGRESVVIDGILQKAGKTLKNPKLKSVGRLKIRKPTKRDNFKPGHGLVVEFTGKSKNIERLTLLDGKGNQINTGTMSFSTRGKKTSTIDAGQKLPPDTKLKIILGGDEKVTEIPFKFENFPLPGGNVKKNNSSRRRTKPSKSQHRKPKQSRAIPPKRGRRKSTTKPKTAINASHHPILHLFGAVSLGDVPRVKKILKNHPELLNRKAPKKQQNAPLHIASDRNQKKVVEFLLSKGADINVKNKFGITPLHKAASGGHKDIVVLLLKRGADATLKNNQGKTALNFAKRHKRGEIFKILRKHELKQ